MEDFSKKPGDCFLLLMNLWDVEIEGMYPLVMSNIAIENCHL